MTMEKKILRAEENKREFDNLLADIECEYRSQSESLSADGTYSVIYRMPDGNQWILVLDDNEDPVSLQKFIW